LGRQRGLWSPRLGGRGAVDRCRHRQPRPRPQATAIGAGSQARLSNSTAIGAGARAERADKVVLGTRTNTYTLSGLNSAASRNAQSGPTRFVTADAQENLAASTFGPATIAALDNRVDNLSRMVQDTRSEARQGIAAAIAMSAAMPSAAGRVSWTVNTGMFKNETAIGGSVAYRLGTWMPLAVNAG
jgi:autotransporter adhesin